MYVDGRCILAFMNCCKRDDSKWNVGVDSDGLCVAETEIDKDDELFIYYGEDYWKSKSGVTTRVPHESCEPVACLWA